MKNRCELLIVDDDISDEMLIRAAIKRLALEVEITTARTAEEGIQKSSQLSSGIVVLDHSLPGMDGYEACQKMKANNDHLKIIICSGAVDSVGAAKAQAAGADDYCLKTADYKILMNAIQNLIPLKNPNKEIPLK